MKKYTPFKQILQNEKNINSEEEKQIFLNSDIFKTIQKVFPNIKADKVIFRKIESFCNEKTPSRVRIRSDRFLKKVKNGNFDCLLVSIIRHLNNKYYYIFLGKSFEGYCFKTNGSNSFLTFEFNELFPDYEKFDIGLRMKEIYKKGGKYITKYFYYLSKYVLSDNYEVDDLISFCKVVTKASLDPYKLPSNLGKNISAIDRKKILELYPLRCICSIGDNLCVNKSIDWDYFEKNPSNNLLHLHHFIPKEHFKKEYRNESELNWKIINNYLNLIPLCSSCHDCIHKGSQNEIEKIINKIFEVQKKIGIYNQFIEFLIENKFYIKINVDQIIEYYLKK